MAFPTQGLSHRWRDLVLLAAGIGLLAAAPAAAAAVTLSITEAVLKTGAGYGIDGNEKYGKLLDVRFDLGNAFLNQEFVLDPGGQFSVGLAWLSLLEPNADGGIQNDQKKDVRYDETDSLGVSWQFTLAGEFEGIPFSRVIEVMTDAVAMTGPVADNAVDYTLDWSPVEALFGSQEVFSMSLDDIQISGSDARVMQAATFRVPGFSVPLPRQAPPLSASVPEPGTIALFALGLAGIGAARRTKAAG